MNSYEERVNYLYKAVLDDDPKRVFEAIENEPYTFATDPAKYSLIWKFRSPVEFVKYVHSLQDSDANEAYQKGGLLESKDDGRSKKEFTQTDDWEDAIHQFFTPQINSDLLYFKEMPDYAHNTSGVSIGWDVQGDWIDMARFMSGEPEVFGYMDWEPQITKVNFTFGHNNVPGGVSGKDVFRWAYLLTSVFQILKRAGVTVNVRYLMCGTRDDDRNQNGGDTKAQAIYMPVLDSSRDINVSMIYSVVHPSFFRRFGFRLVEQAEQYDSGYGRADFEIVTEDMKSMPEDEVYLKFKEDCVNSKEHAVDTINGICKKILGLEDQLTEDEDNLSHFMMKRGYKPVGE